MSTIVDQNKSPALSREGLWSILNGFIVDIYNYAHDVPRELANGVSQT